MAEVGMMEVEALTLQRLRYGIEDRVSREFAEGVEVDTWQDHFLGAMAARLTAHVLAEEIAAETVEVVLEEDVSFMFPSNPWQHLKWSWANFVKRRNFAYRGRWLECIYRPRVKMNAHWRTVRKTFRVRTKQFAAFPAATIRTPDALRGPILVRKEQLDVSDTSHYR